LNPILASPICLTKSEKCSHFCMKNDIGFG
jgi:hypothetical protein